MPELEGVSEVEKIVDTVGIYANRTVCGRRIDAIFTLGA